MAGRVGGLIILFVTSSEMFGYFVVQLRAFPGREILGDDADHFRMSSDQGLVTGDDAVAKFLASIGSVDGKGFGDFLQHLGSACKVFEDVLFNLINGLFTGDFDVGS